MEREINRYFGEPFSQYGKLSNKAHVIGLEIIIIKKSLCLNTSLSSAKQGKLNLVNLISLSVTFYVKKEYLDIFMIKRSVIYLAQYLKL